MAKATIPNAFPTQYFIMTCSNHFDAVQGVVISKYGRDLLHIDTTTITGIFDLSKAYQPIDIVKLSIGFEKTTTEERKKFLYAHLTRFNPPLDYKSSF